MPVSKTRVAAFIFMAAVIGFAIVKYVSELTRTRKHLRSPAAVERNFEGKASGLFQLESAIEKQGAKSKLRLRVKASQDVATAHVEWHLPGRTTGVSAGGFRKGETKEFEFDVDMRAGHSVFAEVYTFLNGFKFGATAGFFDENRAPAETGEAEALSLPEKPKLIQ